MYYHFQELHQVVGTKKPGDNLKAKTFVGNEKLQQIVKNIFL